VFGTRHVPPHAQHDMNTDLPATLTGGFHRLDGSCKPSKAASSSVLHDKMLKSVEKVRGYCISHNLLQGIERSLRRADVVAILHPQHHLQAETARAPPGRQFQRCFRGNVDELASATNSIVRRR
jgi:hypothetical protein